MKTESDLMARLGATETPPVGSWWRHVKGGGVYRVRCVGVIEATFTPCVVYSTGDEDPVTWVRPVSKFLDGRFVRLTPEEALAHCQSTGGS